MWVCHYSHLPRETAALKIDNAVNLWAAFYIADRDFWLKAGFHYFRGLRRERSRKGHACDQVKTKDLKKRLTIKNSPDISITPSSRQY